LPGHAPGAIGPHGREPLPDRAPRAGDPCGRAASRGRSARLSPVIAAALVLAAAASWAWGAEGRATPDRKAAIPSPEAAAPAPDAVAIDQAIARLNSTDWIVQAEAAALLARARTPRAAPHLKAVLAGAGRPWVRGRALVALAEITREGALDDALAAAAGPSPELRAAAMEALGIIGSPRSLAAVEAHMADAALTVRLQAAVAFARMRRQDAWDRIAPLAADSDPAIIRRAAEALAYVGTPDARKALIALLAHKNESVRLAAVQALREVRPTEAIPTILKHMAGDAAEDVKAACWRTLVAYEPETLAKPLLAALAADDQAVYPAALKVLAARPCDEARAGIVAILNDPPDRFRSLITAALDVVAGADPQPYQEVFIKHLDHAQDQVRRKAVEILGQCGRADHFAILKPLLLDADGAVRVAAFKALRRSPRQPPAGIVEYLGDLVLHVHAETFEQVMGLLGDRLTAAEVPKALAALDAVFAGGDDRRRGLALAALERFAADDLNRKVAAAQGFVTNWKTIGPFPGGDERRGALAVYPPELEVDFAKSYDAYGLDRGAAFRDYGAARTIRGANRQSLILRPPAADGETGRIIATYTLDLPKAADLKLTLIATAQSESLEGAGVRFEVDVDGKSVYEHRLGLKDEWALAEVGLEAYGGRRVALDLVADTLPGSKGDWALVADPRVVAGGAVAADLIKLMPTAAVRAVMRGAPSARVSWEPAKAIRMDGLVDLRETVTTEDQRIVYAACDLVSPEDRKVTLAVTADDGAKVWLGGSLLTEKPIAGFGRLEADLKKGPNRLLLKVFNVWDKWHFAVRVTDAAGRRVQGTPAR
jgi:HEAT repeat protein